MITINKASQILGICPDTLKAWEESKSLIPHRTKGGHRRYTHEQLAPFVNEQQNVFIQKVKGEHGDALTFDKVVYDNAYKDVIVTCATHGDFSVNPRHLLNRVFACKRCESDKLTEKIKKDFVGLVVGTRKVVGYHSMRPLATNPSRPCSRLWEAECLNCKTVIVATMDALKKLGVCKVCKGRPKGETGLLFEFNGYKKSAKQRDIDFALTIEQFREITSKPCHYCGADPTPTRGVTLEWSQYLCNGIDRVNNDAGYSVDNCVPCCTTCNSAKMDKSYDDFIQYLDRLVSFRRPM